MEIRRSFEIHKIPEYLRKNTGNTIEYFNFKGQLVKCGFPEIYQNAVSAMRKLHLLGLKKGSTAVIMGKTSYYWLVAEIACIFAGIRTIAMPENFSRTQVVECLASYNIDVVLADAELVSMLAPLKCNVLILNESLHQSDTRNENPEEQYKRIQEQAEFNIVVFTSGTTSKTKSFAIKPGSTARMIRGYIDVFRIEKEDRWLICHPFSHYSHLEYALGGLCAGYNLIISDLTNALAYFKKFQPSLFISVPASYEYFYEQLLRLMNRIPNEERARIDKYMRINPFLGRPKLNQAFGKSICRPLHDFFGGNMKVFVIGAAPSKREVKEFFVRAGLPLYEGYGLTETGMIATNSLNGFRLGSVGKIFPEISVKIREDGVICTRSEEVRVTGYDNFTPEENMETFPGNNCVITGDIGYFDADGFLYVNGRKNEMIITNGGKKINPIKIEEMLSGICGVRHAVVVGNNRPYIIAILDISDEAQNEEKIAKGIKEINKELAYHEQIKDYVITREIFSEQNGLITRSGKIIKKAVEEKYANNIKECYRM